MKVNGATVTIAALLFRPSSPELVWTVLGLQAHSLMSSATNANWLRTKLDDSLKDLLFKASWDLLNEQSILCFAVFYVGLAPNPAGLLLDNSVWRALRTPLLIMTIFSLNALCIVFGCSFLHLCRCCSLPWKNNYSGTKRLHKFKQNI